MQIASRLNIRFSIFIGIIIFLAVNLSNRYEQQIGFSIIPIMGIAILTYVLLSFIQAIRAKHNAKASFEVFSSRKVIPYVVIAFFSVLYIIQLLTFLYSDNRYNTSYFIFNSSIFVAFILSAIHYLIFRQMYITPKGMFYRISFDKRNYEIEHEDSSITLKSKNKFSFISTITIKDKQNMQINKIKELMF